jgi:hypothetical protein
VEISKSIPNTIPKIKPYRSSYKKEKTITRQKIKLGEYPKMGNLQMTTDCNKNAMRKIGTAK